MIGNFAALTSWANARSELTFTADDLAVGRRQVIRIWNAYPTDAVDSNGMYQPVIDISSWGSVSEDPSTAPVFLDDAAYAYALLNAALRMDGQKMPLQGGGLNGNPAEVTPSQIAMATQAVAAFKVWVAETKPRQAAAWLGA